MVYIKKYVKDSTGQIESGVTCKSGNEWKKSIIRTKFLGRERPPSIDWGNIHASMTALITLVTILSTLL